MIYKYYSNLSEYAINNFKNEVLCFSHVDEFNDTLEFNVKMRDDCTIDNSDDSIDAFIKAQKFRLRVCCLSQSAELENMWGYYANQGKGFCLGYDENDFNINGLMINYIKYNNAVPEIYFGMSDDSIVSEQIMHKDSSWKEEKEVRVVLFLNNSNYYRKEVLEYSPINDFCIEPKVITDNVVSLNEIETTFLFLKQKILPCKLYSAKNILFKAKPRELILGRKCEKELEYELSRIGIGKHIPIRKHGGSNV